MKTPKFDLFFTFIRSDSRMTRKYALDTRKSTNKLDLPLLRYALSLKERIQRLEIIHSKIVKSHSETLEEMQQVEKKGYGFCIKSMELNIYYEAFFNEISSIMENISNINIFMFDNCGSVSHKFSNQIKNIKKGTLCLSPEYDKLILEEMEWFSDVSRIRDNTNHFLTGSVVFDKTDDGELIPSYLNYNVSDRNKHESNNFKIEMNISESVTHFYEHIIRLIENISSIYIERMDKDVPCIIRSFKDGTMELRSITYNGYVAGMDGEFVMTLIDPKKKK